MIRVIIPHHLRNLAGTGAEVTVEIAGPATQRAVLDALEARYPVLRGTIRDHAKHVGHYHVAGNPGRHEPDASQELNYPAIMRAVAATGFAGYVAQEFIPTGEPLAALAKAVEICRV